MRRFQNIQSLGPNADLAIMMDATAIEAYQERWTEREGGFDNAGVPLLLETGSEVTPLSVSGRDRESLDMAKFLIGEMSRIWGVPLYILQSDVQSGTGRKGQNDAGEQFLHFVMGDFGATMLAFQDEINLKVLGPNRQVDVVFDYEALTLGSLEKRAQVANSLVQRTAIWTPDYANKRLFKLPPQPGGDELRVPTGGSESSGENDQGGADNDPDPEELPDAPEGSVVD